MGGVIFGRAYDLFIYYDYFFLRGGGAWLMVGILRYIGIGPLILMK